MCPLGRGLAQLSPSARIALLACIFAITPAAAQEGYQVQPGDVVEFSVVAIPNLHRLMRVSPDGEINVPLIGRIPAANHSLSEIEAAIREALPDAIYRQRVEGDELLIVVRPEEVSLEIAEFRPIYVMGDVVKPGEQTYRPELTVRRALAVAGGVLDPTPVISGTQAVQLLDLRADYHASLGEYILAAADISRLRAELAGSTEIASDTEWFQALSPDTVAQIRQVAQEQLSARIAFNEGEKAYLQSAIRQNGQRVAVLREQQRQEQEGVDADTAEFLRIQGLASQQSVQVARVTEARRQLLLSSTRSLSTKVELAAVEIRQADLIRELERFDEQRRMAALGELQEATLKARSLRDGLEAAAEGLTMVAGLIPDTASAASPSLSIMIYRKAGDGEKGFEADLDTAIQPGDVIELSLRED